MNGYRLNSAAIKQCIESCLKARLVPFVQSSPGMGKSSIVKKIAEEYGLKLIDCRLSSLDPSDLQGLPWITNGKAQFNPYDFFPIETTEIPEGYSGFLLFLDEFNSASRATQAAAYRVVLDREIGMHKLHPKCFVVAAGNLNTDNAIVNELSTAMLSRVIHLFMDVSVDDWVENYAINADIDERIISFLHMYPDKLMTFDPDKENSTFASPRTWEFVNKLLKVISATEDLGEKHIPLLGGAITIEHAAAFVHFCSIYSNIVSMETLLKNPNIAVPKDTAAKWATVVHMACNTTKENCKEVVAYISKFPETYKIVYARMAKIKCPTLITIKDFVNLCVGLGDFCFGKSNGKR